MEASARRNRNAVQVLSPMLTFGAPIFNLYSSRLSVSFGPDLFGANRRAVESLQAQADATRDEYYAACPTLAAHAPPGRAWTSPGPQYRSAVLTAFQNVADALRALPRDADAVRADGT